MQTCVIYIYGHRYIKTKIRTYGDNVYASFCSLEHESVVSLLVYKNKYFLQVYLDNGTYKLQTNK